jgi:hypothetical protein
MQITSSQQLRRAFWADHPTADRRQVRDYSGGGHMYKADTRTAWVEYVDHMARDGRISDRLAQSATLERTQ